MVDAAFYRRWFASHLVQLLPRFMSWTSSIVVHHLPDLLGCEYCSDVLALPRSSLYMLAVVSLMSTYLQPLDLKSRSV